MSPALRESTPEIAWRRVRGLRDVLIHNYMGVDLEALWAIVEGGIPPNESNYRPIAEIG